jgi:frataxin-like iron-binding protein CyaY
MPATDDPDFAARAEATMRKVQAALDGFDPDELEADLAGGVLRITFADRKVCVMNRQSAASPNCPPEGATAWHFEFDPAHGCWMDTKGRGRLEQVLGGVLTRRLGRPVTV